MGYLWPLAPGIFDRNTENGLTPQMKELIEGQYDMLLILNKSVNNRRFVSDDNKLKVLAQLQL